MSNVIRSSNRQTPVINKVLSPKAVSLKKPSVIPSTRKLNLQEQRKRLVKMHERLEAVYEQTMEQIKQEQEQARVKLSEWQQEKEQEIQEHAQQVAEQAYSEGYETGVSQGLQSINQEMAQQREELQAVLEEGYRERDLIIQDAEPFLLSLSTKIASKVLQDEIAFSPEKLRALIKSTLKQISDRENITIQIAADDYPAIVPYLEELEKYVDSSAELKIIPIHDFTKGSCLIHTGSGSYDVSIDNQLAEIKKQLLAYFEENHSDES
ncbi:FliH/SctL family protein [Pseudalkalibacillus caeni]|uniref:FliH/SctL family protein n=1 Tax=Exobacillus caeni TaxID=2574798 RepID=UPI001484FEAE|nr:FliH/SctL family protein [Pseudalkalibacillus caeni]